MQALIIPMSWLLSAAIPDSHVHSLLSNEGVRWLFGHITENIASPVLVWIVLLCIAIGAVVRSKLAKALFSNDKTSAPKTYQERMAIRVVIIEIILAIVIMFLLTAIPHAILLSATGQLFPSSFSRSILPTTCATMVVCSVTYGLVSGTINNLTSFTDTLTYGIAKGAPFILLYVIAAQLIASIMFVIN